MKFLFILIVVACAGLISSCEKTASVRMDSADNVPLYGCRDRGFPGETVRICFDSLVSDSRCPANVVCVWQGTATGKFSFVKDNQVYPLTLSTISISGVYVKDTIVAGYKIEFVDLKPYPGTDHPDDTNNIEAEVTITKL